MVAAAELWVVKEPNQQHLIIDEAARCPADGWYCTFFATLVSLAVQR